MQHNIIDYGANGDGKEINTSFIQAAIDKCACGDEVIIPKGVFLTGALFLKSNTKLVFEDGAVLLGSSSINDYPVYKYRFEGKEQLCYASLLNTLDGKHENIQICGHGIIDGAGDQLYGIEKEDSTIKRGRIICFRNTKNVVVNDVVIYNTVAWTMHFVFCKNVEIKGVSIYSKRAYGFQTTNELLKNGDGIVIDSCEDVDVKECTIESQDDCISVKSGKGKEGRMIGIPSKNVQVTQCCFIGGAGISVGSEMSGGIEGLLVNNCTFKNVLSILSIKTNSQRGGYIKDISVICCSLKNIDNSLKKKDYKASIYIDEHYDEHSCNEKLRPTVENIILKEIDIVNSLGKAIFVNGLIDEPIRNVIIQDFYACSVGDYDIQNAEVVTENVCINNKKLKIINANKA